MVTAIGDVAHAQWLEPCVGRGVFIEALTQFGVPSQRIRGLDIDPAASPADSDARVHRGYDFLQWSMDTDERFDRIVANPPYLSLRRLPPELRRVALGVAQPDGAYIPATANCWFAFLCAGWRLLRPGGALCFVLPAAWEYADYARQLRAAFPTMFEKVEVHRCAHPLFETVQEGSVVLLAKGHLGRSVGIRKRYHMTPKALIAALGAIDPSLKTGSECASTVRRRQRARVRLLAEVMDIRLGGVTGDVDYFLLSETQRQEYGLPIACLRPVVSKAQHLRGSELTYESWCSLRDIDARVWLFRPCQRMLGNPAVAAYLAEGQSRPAGYKVSIRKPWYVTPLPRICDGFVSGMSSVGPWFSLRMMPRLTASNTLYTVRFSRRYSLEQKAAWALALLTSDVREQLQGLRRVYAAGLAKFEPGDLNRLILPEPSGSSGARDFLRTATDALLKSGSCKAAPVADRWFRLSQ